MAKFVVFLWLISLPFSAPFAAEVIKRSESGLCHDKNSQWYERPRKFTAYASMQNCLAAGGKAYSGYITHTQATITEGYKRDLFPHWLDEDGNCRDTRAETLIRQSQVPVAFAGGAGCQVTSGRWYDPYTNSTFTDDDELDIDHIVPYLQHRAKYSKRELEMSLGHGRDVFLSPKGRIEVIISASEAKLLAEAFLTSRPAPPPQISAPEQNCGLNPLPLP